ncbi:MAG TPA: hypothetical protein ENK18_20235 [Deltaproteobacteria bacterium]|nr:hypothetical protein [Deltaproteobacteria bacterium]
MWMFSLAASASPLSGIYHLDEPLERLTRAHQRAVEAGVAQLPRAVRPFARPRLQGAVGNCAQVELQLSEARFTSRCDRGALFQQARAERSRDVTGEDGKPYAVTLEVVAEAVTVSFSGKEGGQRFIYLPQPDGTLLLKQEIFSPWLAEPISWTARYRRSE